MAAWVGCLWWLPTLVVVQCGGCLGRVCPAMETIVMGLAMLRALRVCGRERPSLVLVPHRQHGVADVVSLLLDLCRQRGSGRGILLGWICLGPNGSRS